MQFHTYYPHELRVAFCYRVYLVWRTHRVHPIPFLASLPRSILDSLVRPYNIRVLECASTETELRCIVSLQPTESTCASKVKGRVSKWLREGLHLQHPMNLLSKGYFACTIGKTRSKFVERYLSSQAEHHGYDQRILPPVFCNEYRLESEDEVRLAAKHAAVNAKFHLVLSTQGRVGIFGSKQGERIANAWRQLQDEFGIALLKVSFVPDHVHIAVKAHPTASPTGIAANLMNSAQQVVQGEMIEAGVDRLWSDGVYVGSYGDFASAQIRKYLENWRAE
jgi:putative transposase